VCHVWLGVSSMEVKTESDADCMILECPHDDKPNIGMFSFFDAVIIFVCLFFYFPDFYAVNCT